MTQRKPKNMTFSSWIDAQLDQARIDGQFEDLEGAGKPLENLDSARDPLWWAKSFLRREGIDMVPPAMEVRRKVEKLREMMPEYRQETEIRAAIEALNDEIRRLNMYAHKGPPTTQAPLDLETELERWRGLRKESQ